VLNELSKISLVDVVLPTSAWKSANVASPARPNTRKSLLQHLGLKIPQQFKK